MSLLPMSLFYSLPSISVTSISVDISITKYFFFYRNLPCNENVNTYGGNTYRGLTMVAIISLSYFTSTIHGSTPHFSNNRIVKTTGVILMSHIYVVLALHSCQFRSCCLGLCVFISYYMRKCAQVTQSKRTKMTLS